MVHSFAGTAPIPCLLPIMDLAKDLRIKVGDQLFCSWMGADNAPCLIIGTSKHAASRQYIKKRFRDIN
jgi:hypothetical protein